MMTVDEVTNRLIGAAIEVHRTLGPGLLESVYEACLCHELSIRRVEYERQPELPVAYKGVDLHCSYRVDLVVERLVVAEIKAVTKFEPVFTAQVLTYLRLGGWPVGLILNFGAPVMIEGVKRVVNAHRP